MICPSFPTIENVSLHIQQGFNIKIYTTAKLNVPKNWSIEELIENLGKIIEPDETGAQISAEISNKQKKNIYDEISCLYAPDEYEILLDNNCSRVRFTKFLQNEHHFLEVALPNLEVVNHSLPSCIDLQNGLGKIESLSMLLHQYRTFLDGLKPFYDHFTDIDELCHVVQPSLPNFKENWRLFVLKERVFLKVQFSDPFSPLSSMSVNIIGPTTEVTQLRRVYSEGMRDWDSELDVHKNLLRIFDLCFFPMAPAENSSKSLQHCNICYSYKEENGEIPIVSCDNNHCSLIFHAACLKEWFNMLTDGKTFLDVAFGSCPFCKSVGCFV